MFATYFVIDVVVCMMCILIMCHNMCKTWTSWFPPGYQEAFQGTAPNHRAEDGRTVVKQVVDEDQMETDNFLVGKPIDFKATDFSHSRHFLIFEVEV